MFNHKTWAFKKGNKPLSEITTTKSDTVWEFGEGPAVIEGTDAAPEKKILLGTTHPLKESRFQLRVKLVGELPLGGTDLEIKVLTGSKVSLTNIQTPRVVQTTGAIALNDLKKIYTNNDGYIFDQMIDHGVDRYVQLEFKANGSFTNGSIFAEIYPMT